MDNHHRKDVGERGEALALQYLQAAGLKLLQRNYRCKCGEIDLIMNDAGVLVLVEVRLRSNRSFGGAAASVQRTKQQRLLRAAQHLLLTHTEYRQHRARFDLVAIDGGGARPEINWIKDAFR